MRYHLTENKLNAHEDGSRRWEIDKLDYINSLTNIIVAIGYESQGNYNHLGTGFIYKGFIITCTHLLDLDRFWIGFDSNPKSAEMNFSSLRILLCNHQKIQFETALKVTEEKSFIWPHYDVALLGLQKNINNDGIKHIENISNSSYCLFAEKGDASSYERGSVYAIAAQKKYSVQNPAIFWLEGGSIVFPCKLRRSFNDPNYKRVLRYAIADKAMDQIYNISIRSKIPKPRKLESLARSIQQTNKMIKSAYSNQSSGLYRYFMADIEHSNLDDLARIKRFQTNPTWNGKTIHAFGTDLDTAPGVSGAPIFKILDGNKDQLIGIHHGVSSSTGSNRPVSLNNYSIEIPLQHVINDVDKKIKQLEKKS
jgi:hypothetical protein